MLFLSKEHFRWKLESVTPNLICNLANTNRFESAGPGTVPYPSTHGGGKHTEF
jgi:hypothetical protein